MTTIGDALDRLVLIEQELINPSVAKPFPAYDRADFPFWTNTPAFQSVRNSGGLRVLVYTVTMRLYRGNFTEGVEGEIQTQCISDLDAIVKRLVEQPRLTYNNAPLNGLDAGGCVLTGGRVTRFEADEGATVARIGVLITLDVPLMTSIRC